MCDFLTYFVVVCCLSAWLLILAAKWGFIEWVQVHGNSFFRQMFSCNFCLSWWTAWLVSGILFLVTWDFHVLFLPFVTTPVTRMML